MPTIFIKNAETKVALLVKVWDLNDSSNIPKAFPLAAQKYHQMDGILVNQNDQTSSIKWLTQVADHEDGKGGPITVADGQTYNVNAGSPK